MGGSGDGHGQLDEPYQRIGPLVDVREEPPVRTPEESRGATLTALRRAPWTGALLIVVAILLVGAAAGLALVSEQRTRQQQADDAMRSVPSPPRTTTGLIGEQLISPPQGWADIYTGCVAPGQRLLESTHGVVTTVADPACVNGGLVAVSSDRQLAGEPPR